MSASKNTKNNVAKTTSPSQAADSSLNSWALTGAILACTFPPAAPISLIISIIGLTKSKAGGDDNRGLAIAGIAVSSFFILVFAGLIALVAILEVYDSEDERNLSRQGDTEIIEGALKEYASRHQSRLPATKDDIVDGRGRFVHPDPDISLEAYADVVFYDVQSTTVATKSYYGATTEVNQGLGAVSARLPDKDNIHIFIGWQCKSSYVDTAAGYDIYYDVEGGDNFQRTSGADFIIVWRLELEGEDGVVRCTSGSTQTQR